MIMILLALLFQATGTPLSTPAQHRNAGSAVVPRDAADSVKYFIKIVPHDSTTDERMPSASPEKFISVDVSPIPIKQVEGTYPETDPKQGPAATVWVSCMILKSGAVGMVKVTRADDPRLAEPAIAAAKQWRFIPARIGGKVIAVWAAIPIRFRAKY